MPYFEHCGAQLYYEEHGSGHPLLFLHGASWDLRQWQRQVDYYAPRYRVIAMDARGHGKSSLPPGEVSPDIFWQDANALLEHLQISQAIICGLSLGGHTAIQVAFNAPDKVTALILIGAPCSNKFNLYEKICVPINRFSLRLMPISWLAWSLAVYFGKSNPQTKAYIKNVVGSLEHDAFNRVWKAATSMESRDELSKIKCPTLILIGEKDSMTRRQQPFIQQSIKGSRLVTIKNANHSTNLDNPQQVEQEIDAFLHQIVICDC